MTSRFICEIVALIIFGIWGFQQGKMIGAIGVPYKENGNGILMKD
ncbi:DUF2568 domain-containing protein [Bacillus sp. BGMRC 2118]|nr:DUF2568 domain-containing protein [Bacillus sp. BGMRC 2118]